jgi:hypothetical protein
MQAKKLFLLFAFLAVSIIALLYGLSPEWFAQTFLGVENLDANLAHILRAVMGLYLAFGFFWCFSAFDDRLRGPAVLTTIVFSAGLVSGRLVSLAMEGKPSALLIFYMAVEFVLIPVALYVYRLPE